MFEIDQVHWEITDTFECIDTDHYEGACEADVNGVAYVASCIIYKGSGDVCGTIVDIDASTIERLK